MDITITVKIDEERLHQEVLEKVTEAMVERTKKLITTKAVHAMVREMEKEADKGLKSLFNNQVLPDGRTCTQAIQEVITPEFLERYKNFARNEAVTHATNIFNGELRHHINKFRSQMREHLLELIKEEEKEQEKERQAHEGDV